MRREQGGAVVAVVLLVGAGCGGGGDSGVAGDEARRGSPQQDAVQYEIGFMTGMIDHHWTGIEMSEPCAAGAIHAQLGELCANIVATQSAEIGQMQQWLLAWYDVEHEPGGGMMMPMAGHLDGLSGPQLEVAFMRMMIPHHLQAVRDASACGARASHGELKELCARIVATQTAEIEQMNGWLCEWYAMCGGGGMGGMGPMGGGSALPERPPAPPSSR